MSNNAPTIAPADATHTDQLTANLRQMIAVLERERQALAGLDRDELVAATMEKEALCEKLTPIGPEMVGAEARSLAETARHLNEVNRRVRNLLAANVAARLDALGTPRATYPEPRLTHA